MNIKIGLRNLYDRRINPSDFDKNISQLIVLAPKIYLKYYAIN